MAALAAANIVCWNCEPQKSVNFLCTGRLLPEFQMSQKILKYVVIVASSLEIGIGIALLILGAYQFSNMSCLYYLGHGIWTGIFLALVGLTGLVFMGKRRCPGITHVSLAVLSFFVVLPILVGLNVVEMQSDINKHCWNNQPSTNCTRRCSYVDYILQRNITAKVKRDLQVATTDSVLGFDLMPDGSQSYLCRSACTNDTRNDPAVVDETVQIISASFGFICLLVTSISVSVQICKRGDKNGGGGKQTKVKPIQDGFFGSDPHNLDLSLRPSTSQGNSKLGVNTSGLNFPDYKPKQWRTEIPFMYSGSTKEFIVITDIKRIFSKISWLNSKATIASNQLCGQLCDWS